MKKSYWFFFKESNIETISFDYETHFTNHADFGIEVIDEELNDVVAVFPYNSLLCMMVK